MDAIRIGEECRSHIRARLEEGTPVRRRAGGRRVRAAALLAAALVALMSLAVAVAYHTGMLDLFFQGDTQLLKPYVQANLDSGENGDYRLTVDSAVNTGHVVCAVITVEGLNDRAAADLMSNKAVAEAHRDLWGQSMSDSLMESGSLGPDTLRACFTEGGEPASGIISRELPAPSNTSRSWQIEISMQTADGQPASGPISLWLNFMGGDCAVQIPTDVAAETVSLSIGREVPSQWPGGMPVFIRSLELTPIGLSYEGTYWDEGRDDRAVPVLLFRMADGRTVTMAQLGGRQYSARRIKEPDWYLVRCKWDTVLDLRQVESIILGDMAFPLDGSRPRRMEAERNLYPFETGLLPYTCGGVDSGGETDYLASLEDLCRGLGADYHWDGRTKTAAASYLGTTISLTADSSTALVDGRPVEMRTSFLDEAGETIYVPLPAVENEGSLAASISFFTGVWQMDVDIRQEQNESGAMEFIGFLIIP